MRRRRSFMGRPFLPRQMRRPFGQRPLPGRPPVLPRARWFSLGAFALLAFPATGAMYKIHREDVRRIEQDSGVSVRNMTEEELQAAMTRLKISGTEFTEADRVAAGWQQPSAKLTAEDLDLLERLTQMMYSGQLTEDEYEAKRKEILGL